MRVATSSIEGMVIPARAADVVGASGSGHRTYSSTLSASMHVGFPESIRLISDALGLGVDSIEQHIEPIIAKVARPARDRTVEPGQVAGCNHTAVGRREGEEVIRLIHPQQVAPEAEGQETGDFITITGVPDISMSTGPEIAGGKATAGICVNTIPRIVAATPGLKRIIDLPSPCALMGPSAYERR